jgi:predicted Rossmann-fold nucleotide-binding protein
MGTEYWHHMQEFLRNTMLASNTIGEEDLNLAFLTDSPDEAVNHIRNMMAKETSTREALPDIY